MSKTSDETQRSLQQIYLALEVAAEGLHRLADLTANRLLDDETRRAMAEAVHRLADRIEEMD